MIEDIRLKIRQDEFEFSRHAVNQSLVRHISLSEIREAVESGEIIEDYPDDKYGPSCLILGLTAQGTAPSMQLSFPAISKNRDAVRTESEIVGRIQGKEADQMNQEEAWSETIVEQKVRYIIESSGKIFVIENVPARVCLETGEQLFSPATVERLQQTVWGMETPKRVIETDVFEFAA